ncbi:hypothetical protein PRK78_004502 [Emydomyces testavorans]|uniref:Uncharacterized protein n=1 Tax=Emydomyces testavorans TaxID=2070801 RepID=A0AAF0DHW5_9EURO|nr:hypothetical protein PRK78_004502 [Emydomyces testavorans]
MIVRSHTASFFFLILSSLLPLILADTPTSFCKCTCFSNSTIIPLGPPKPHTSSRPKPDKRSIPAPSFFDTFRTNEDSAAVFSPRKATSEQPTQPETDNPNSSADDKDDKKFRAANCNDCNRKFCLDYQLPMCKGAKEADVVTTCFR